MLYFTHTFHCFSLRVFIIYVVVGTRKFVNKWTTSLHRSLSWANSVHELHSLSNTLFMSVLILSSQRRLGLPSGLTPAGFPIITLCTVFSHSCDVPGLPESRSPDYLDYLGDWYNFSSSWLCNIFYSPLSSSIFAPNICLTRRVYDIWITDLNDILQNDWLSWIYQNPKILWPNALI